MRWVNKFSNIVHKSWSQEIVTPYNINYLQDLICNGPTAYPGALQDTGEHIDLWYNKCADAFLQYGW